MITIPRTWEQWFKSLVAAIVSGFANAVLTALGLGGAAMMGIKVPQLEWHQVLSIGVSGAFIGACFYLKQSPVAPDSNTNFLKNPQPGPAGAAALKASDKTGN